MAVENRLTPDQLAALAPGDSVVIETSGDFRRPRQSTGTVVRIDARHLVITCRSPRGVAYVHQFGRRDGVRIGGGGQRAELVNADPASGLPENQQRELRIDAAYRAWTRNRGDVEALRELHAALGERLSEQQPVT